MNTDNIDNIYNNEDDEDFDTQTRLPDTNNTPDDEDDIELVEKNKLILAYTGAGHKHMQYVMLESNNQILDMNDFYKYIQKHIEAYDEYQNAKILQEFELEMYEYKQENNRPKLDINEDNDKKELDDEFMKLIGDLFKE